MKRHLIMTAVIATALLFAVREARADVFTFETLPAGGALVADTGATTGWGYNITNPSATLWLLITDISHDPVQHGTMDTFVFDFPLLAPLASAALAYDQAGALGLAEFTWDGSAPAGFVNAGLFFLGGELYSDDPFAGGQFVLQADVATAPFSIEARRNVVPEPAALLLIGLGGVLGVARRRGSVG